MDAGDVADPVLTAKLTRSGATPRSWRRRSTR